MKKLTLILGIITAVLTAKAGNEQYVQIMKQQLVAIDSAKTEADFTKVISVLERIASAETSEWHPTYYIAYSYLNIAFRQSEMAQRDAKLDIAQTWIDKALAIAPNHSEVLTLQGYILMMKVSVDPAARGQQLVGKTMQFFSQAMAIDPQNPRALYLMGQMSFGTAQFFGTDTSEACGLISQSIALFETPTEGSNALAPKWGKNQAIGMQKKCEGK